MGTEPVLFEITHITFSVSEFDHFWNISFGNYFFIILSFLILICVT